MLYTAVGRRGLFYTAVGRMGRDHRPAPGPGPAPSIVIAPRDPPSFGSLPAEWSPTVTVTGIPQVKWGVFQVSADGTQWTSRTGYTMVTIPGGNGSFSPAAQMLRPRDRLVVQNMDETLRDVSGPAVLNAPPATGTGHPMARAFVSDLCMGANIERDGLILAGRITSAQLAEYRRQGLTHIRYFVPVKPDWSWAWPPRNPEAGDYDHMIEVVERTMGEGLKVMFDLLDLCGEEELRQRQIVPYVRSFARRIASRNWDVSRYCLGAVNEYAGGTNASHRAKMHELTGVLRAELPHTLLSVGGGYWKDPDFLVDGSFVPPPDDRIIVDWHKYDEADHIGTSQRLHQRVSRWAAANNLVTFCGEWGIGPPDWSHPRTTWQDTFPRHIDLASRGMGPQRPTMHCITHGGAWRLNQGSETSSAALTPAIAAAFGAAKAHISSQPWFQPIQYGGGTTPRRRQSR